MMYSLQGNYSVVLQTFEGPAAYISQVGDVPGYANSLLFSSDEGGGNLTVSLNGTVIPMSVHAVGSTVNPNDGPIITYIGDIRAFTGQQNVTLQFTGGADLDDIQFRRSLFPSRRRYAHRSASFRWPATSGNAALVRRTG